MYRYCIPGDMIWVYMHHAESRNLQQDQLYSDDIYPTKRQPEILALCGKDRFLSVAQTLSAKQIQTLTDMFQTLRGGAQNV